jgi:hypothetical protein
LRLFVGICPLFYLTLVVICDLGIGCWLLGVGIFPDEEEKIQKLIFFQALFETNRCLPSYDDVNISLAYSLIYSIF